MSKLDFSISLIIEENDTKYENNQYFLNIDDVVKFNLLISR